jgi:hypothetical protein
MRERQAWRLRRAQRARAAPACVAAAVLCVRRARACSAASSNSGAAGPPAAMLAAGWLLGARGGGAQGSTRTRCTGATTRWPALAHTAALLRTRQPAQRQRRTAFSLALAC